MNKNRYGGLIAFLAVWLTGGAAHAFFDNFESYTNGTTFMVATNGWQASTNGVQVQTNTVYDGTNAVIMPQVSTLTNVVSSDMRGASFTWMDCRILPTLGTLPAAGEMTNSSDSVRLCFVKTSDTSGYMAIESNRDNWVICSSNAAGAAVATQISNQWVRVSILADYSRSNAAVFVDGELLRGEEHPACAEQMIRGVVELRVERLELPPLLGAVQLDHFVGNIGGPLNPIFLPHQ